MSSTTLWVSFEVFTSVFKSICEPFILSSARITQVHRMERPCTSSWVRRRRYRKGLSIAPTIASSASDASIRCLVTTQSCPLEKHLHRRDTLGRIFQQAFIYLFFSMLFCLKDHVQQNLNLR